MLKTVIVEDNGEMRNALKKTLSEIPIISLVGEAANGDEGFQLIVNSKPDIVFLDVDLPGKSGLDIAKLVYEMDKKKEKSRTFIVFATGYEEFAINAFEYYAFDYLVKPFNLDRIKETVRKIHSTISGHKRDHKVIVKTESGLTLVSMDEILFVTKEGRSTFIYTADQSIKIVDTLESFEKNLRGDVFLRTHKSYIVNTTKIKEVKAFGRKSFNLIMSGTKDIAVLSKDRFKDLESMIKN